MSEAPKQTWEHQIAAIQYLKDHTVTCLTAKMGAGKSKMIIEMLRAKGTAETKRSVILCPKAVMSVWRGQFATHAPGEFNVLILDGNENSSKKAEKIHHALIQRAAGGQPLVVVVNYESASIGTFVSMGQRKKINVMSGKISSVLCSTTWEAVTSDESQKLKGYNTQTSMWAWEFGNVCGSKVGMTGTLMPNSPMDVFGQYRFLDERIFGKYITHFRNRYGIPDRNIPQKIKEWINQEEMSEKVNRIRYAVADDVLVLPEKQEIIIHVPLAPAGLKAYRDMRKEAIAEIKRVRDDGEEFYKTAIAVNGGVKFLRLLQIAQGYVRDDEGEDIDVDTQKRKALLELLEESMGEPVCVYAWFHHDMKCIQDCCSILGLRYGELSGRQGRPRSCMNDHGEMAEDIDVSGVQMKSGGSGINLTRSSIGIFMNTGMVSPGDYDQVQARQHRPGQTKNLRYYFLVTPGTVDETIARARQEKRDVVDAILNSEEFF